MSKSVLDSIGILRVFVRRYKLFLAVFLPIMIAGVAFIIYKQQSNSSQFIGTPKDEYIFSFMPKAFDGSLVPNKHFINQAIVVATQRIIERDEPIASIIKSWQVVVPQGDFGRFQVMFAASSAQEAQMVYERFMDELNATNEIKTYNDYVASLSQFVSFPKGEELLRRGNVYESKIKELLENGVLLFSEPSLVRNVYLTSSSIGNKSMQEKFSPRFPFILLLASAFICGCLAVFIAEFIKQNSKALRD